MVSGAALRALALMAALLLIPAAQAQDFGDDAADLPSLVAVEEIAVSSDYRGSVVTVIGFNPDRRGRGDVVVVVRGPNQPARVMRKRRLLGLWINSDPVVFSQAPSFFAVLSSRPLREIAAPQAIWSLELDPAASARLASATPEGADPSEYRAALVRLRTAQGLYQTDNAGLTLVEGGMFRATVRLPANAPIAEYQADSYVFRNGRLVFSKRNPIVVSRVGIERRIHDLATNASLLYGLLTVALALGTGWGAAYFFRRS